MNESDERKKVEKKLGLDSITELTPELLPGFLKEMPSMSKESVMAIVSNLPDFQNLLTGAMDQVHHGTNSVLRANWKSQRKVHAAFDDYRKMIDRELQREPVDPEERYFLLGLVKEAIEMETAVNADHQSFSLATVKTVAAAGAAIGIAVVVTAAAVLNTNTDNKA